MSGFFPSWQVYGDVAEPINAAMVANDSGSFVFSQFDVDDMTVEFAGSPLPLRAGDTAVVVGRPGTNGLFKARFVGLPRQSARFSSHGVFSMIVIGIAASVLSLLIVAAIGQQPIYAPRLILALTVIDAVLLLMFAGQMLARQSGLALLDRYMKHRHVTPPLRQNAL